MTNPRRGRRDDLYPSRTGGKTQILERQDPVVARGRDGALPEGPLRPGELVAYERRGFLTVDRVLEPERVLEMREALARLVLRHGDEDAPHVVREPASRVVRSIFDVHRRDPVFARVAHSKPLVGIAEQILGGPVYIHQSRVNVKPAFDGKEFWWHSDFETWHVEDGMPRIRCFSVSISLVDNKPWNGPVMVVPGSHRRFVSCPGKTPENHHLSSLRRQEHGVPDRETVEQLVEEGGLEMPVGGAGSVLIFDGNVMHGSNGNITPEPRSNFFVVYNAVDNAPGEPFSGQPPRPEHIASRDLRPIRPEVV